MISSSGILRYNAILAIAPPNKREPVSPIITFAGCKLNTKNARQLPIKILPNIVISFIPKIIPMTVKQVRIMVVTLVQMEYKSKLVNSNKFSQMECKYLYLFLILV